MPLKYFRRLNAGDGVGINISGSGLSVSKRTKYGSFGTSGFSIRTGIPGLSYRSSWGGSKSNGLSGLILLLFSVLVIYIAYNLIVFIGVLIYNLVGSLIDAVSFAVRIYRIKMLENKLKKDRDFYEGSGLVKFVSVSDSSGEFGQLYMTDIALKNGSHINAGDQMCKIGTKDISAPIHAPATGRITWYKIHGQPIYDGDYIALIEL